MKLPLVPTVIVAAAAAYMVHLGLWQLDRLHQWEHQQVLYQAAAALPPQVFPDRPPSDVSPYLFRKSNIYCADVLGWSATSGRNMHEQTGWKHLASCFTGVANAAPVDVDIGWSTESKPPLWSGGQVNGFITTDDGHTLRLIADEAAPGLQPSAVPSPDSIPNNHLSYALQWFSFAIIAIVIYLLALRRRAR